MLGKALRFNSSLFLFVGLLLPTMGSPAVPTITPSSPGASAPYAGDVMAPWWTLYPLTSSYLAPNATYPSSHDLSSAPLAGDAMAPAPWAGSHESALRPLPSHSAPSASPLPSYPLPSQTARDFQCPPSGPPPVSECLHRRRHLPPRSVPPDPGLNATNDYIISKTAPADSSES